MTINQKGRHFQFGLIGRAILRLRCDISAGFWASHSGHFVGNRHSSPTICLTLSGFPWETARIRLGERNIMTELTLLDFRVF